VSKGCIRESDARAGGGWLREELSTFLGPTTAADCPARAAADVRRNKPVAITIVLGWLLFMSSSLLFAIQHRGENPQHNRRFDRSDRFDPVV